MRVFVAFTLIALGLLLQAPRALSQAAVGEPSYPSIFTALEEQLRLKLESRKVPVEVIVIDAADKPSEK